MNYHCTVMDNPTKTIELHNKCMSEWKVMDGLRKQQVCFLWYGQTVDIVMSVKKLTFQYIIQLAQVGEIPRSIWSWIEFTDGKFNLHAAFQTHLGWVLVSFLASYYICINLNIKICFKLSIMAAFVAIWHGFLFVK